MATKVKQKVTVKRKKAPKSSGGYKTCGTCHGTGRVKA